MQDAIGVESTPVAIRRAHQFYGAAVTNSRQSATWLLKLALTLFTVGLVAIIAIFLTPILTDGEPGLWLYLTAMLTPLGFLCAIVFALWSGRRAR
ncbi:hypothetical protein NFA_6380 [Nocardia farcinica IFM 10152]|uniref:Integral membrane protein n=1 Tax=Nocardia farcinica (strain IFM 10152) TaxID=247156 RepID=Q5Z258_NOCFA|nr:hypothetical protein NFA_6380 [Nocardia farcinica IFM 10152]